MGGWTPLAFDAGGLADRLAGPPRTGARLFWLGQAGFVLEMAGRRLVIDPYLSDALAAKYRGKRFSHARMMPAPVRPDELGDVDLVLATHHHGDHMDGETLAPLMARCAKALLVAPAASAALAAERAEVAPERLVAMDAGQTCEPVPGIRITATPAAHETIERDAAGRHRFLGYLIEAENRRVWHSGDCVPFDGLVGTVSALAPDVALLPVNGRRPDLSNNGVPGNFSICEAIAVARAAGCETLIAHHYGLFAFNSVDPDAIDGAANGAPLEVLRARTGVSYESG